jgi:hypothetical protein
VTIAINTTRGLSKALAKCLSGRREVVRLIDITKAPGANAVEVNVSMILGSRQMKPLVEWIVKSQASSGRRRKKK